MKRFHMAALCGTLLSPIAFAADQPPSDTSIRAVLEVTHASKLIDTTYAQMDGMVNASIKQATAGRPLNEEQKAIAEDMGRQMSEIFKGTMSWEKLEPVMIEVYKKSFTQSDVDGMLKFYRSPAGQAVIQKLPAVMQNTMQAMQGSMQEMLPKVQKLAQETAEKMKAAGSKDAPKP